MRILQLCKKFPYPPKDGEAIAILSLTKSLSLLGHEVTVLALNTKKHYFNISQLPEEIRQIATFYAVDIDTQVNVISAFKNLFTSRSYHIERFYSVRFKAKLIELLSENSFDVIHLETLYLVSYIDVIRKYSNAIISLRSHNVEHEIWDRLTSNQKFGLKKFYLSHLTNKLKKFEIDSFKDYDVMVPISERDNQRFIDLGWRKDSFVLPTGIDLNLITDDSEITANPSVFFIGGLDWLPNQEGIQWFLDQIWPKLRNAHPKLSFYLAGRNIPQWMKNLNYPGLIVVGEVEDAHEFINSKSIMIVPLFSGSGMRIKIIEAMAHGKAIVSTSIGAEGIAYENGKNLFIADNSESFYNCLEKLIENKTLVIEIGKSARKLIESQYDNDTLTKGLLEFYQKHMIK